MSVVVGITNSKDSGCALIKDGVLLAAANEERFNREKLTQEFPYRSLSYVLAEANLTIEDVDCFGVGMWSATSPPWAFPAFVNECLDRSEKKPDLIPLIRERFNASLQSDSRKRQLLFDGLDSLGIEKSKIVGCDHHLAHAITASYFSPYSEAIVLTMDGRGDHQSSSLRYWFRDEGFQFIHGSSELSSLGAFYGWVTGYLGFTPDKHEGKVTGLAANGINGDAVKSIFSEFLFLSEGDIVSVLGDCYSAFMRSELPSLRQKLKPFSREDVAAGAQSHLEDLVKNYLAYHVKSFGKLDSGVNLALSGGIFANVRLNLSLKDLDFVNSLYVFPHMGDGGLSVGGAAFASLKLGDSIKPMRDAYLGPSPNSSKKEILDICNVNDLFLEEFDSESFLAKKIAIWLDNEEIIGLCQGRMEFGPRALGNRSILANPLVENISSILNERLNRSDFMPFAPVILKEKASSLLCSWDESCMVSQYMTCCYKCKPLLSKMAPSIVHADNTARPQIADKSINSLYHAILKEFDALSSCPVLINTSFNLHETPIVESSAQAIDVLLKGGVDRVIIGDRLVVSRPK